MTNGAVPATDLLIVGAGHLGARVAALWRASFVDAGIVAETRTPARHATLAAAGARPRLRADAPPLPASNVLIALPPSAVEDYAAEAARAAALWSRTGRLLLISSTAVYAEQDGGLCGEDAPLADHARAARLLQAEHAVLAVGGSVLRLVGLYDGERGPHRVYLRAERSDQRPDGLVNLIHYDDAAALCLAALTRGAAGAIYLGCDDQPVTRRQLLSAALRSPLGAGATSSERDFFTGSSGPLGRRCDNGWTRRTLQWQPRFPSFEHWLATASASG
jgi:hypothetical protein